MNTSGDLITFFLPQPMWPKDLPENPDQNWSGFGLGMYTWTIQTYLRLKRSGVPCQLTSTLPDEGIVLCHSNVIRGVQPLPAPKRFLICMKAEASLSAIAPMHIVQNPTEASPASERYFIPHWPQPGLMARSPERGNKLENIAFFGHQNSLTPELQSDAWRNALAERQLTETTICNNNRWNQHNNIDTRWSDYRNIDAIVAVRSFSLVQRVITGKFSNKPATKLYNAWLAGVIPILGAESAYQTTGQSRKDYIEVKSFKALLDCLSWLKSDAVARQTILAYGKHQSKNYSADTILRKWQFFLNMVAIPAYYQWCQLSSREQKQMMLATKAASLIDRAKRKCQRTLLKKP